MRNIVSRTRTDTRVTIQTMSDSGFSEDEVILVGELKDRNKIRKAVARQIGHEEFIISKTEPIQFRYTMDANVFYSMAECTPLGESDMESEEE